MRDRPLEDTGLLIHLPPVFWMSDESLDWHLSEARAMGFTWVCGILDDPWSCVKKCAELGMFYIHRPYARASVELYPNSFAADACKAYGMRPRYVLYNEPGSFLEEWPGEYIESEAWAMQTWANRWFGAARLAHSYGAKVGIQTMDPPWLEYLLERIKNEAPEFIPDLFIAEHHYSGEHPPPYPYDALNPGKTIDEDWYAFLRPLKALHIAEKVLGHKIEVVCTEGGWTYDTQEERGTYNEATGETTFRYPRIGYKEHKEYHLAGPEMMRTGIMPGINKPIPDEWACTGYWLLTNFRGGGGDQRFEECAWYSDTMSGTKQQTIDAFKAYPRYVRKLRGEQQPEEEIPTMPQDSLTSVIYNMWQRQGVNVSPDDGFFKYAVEQARNGVFIVPQPSKDGNFTVDIDGYRIAYTMPPMYAKIDDWGNVKTGLPF